METEKLTSKIKPYLNELSKFNTIENEFLKSSAIPEASGEIQPLELLVVNILEKMYADLRHYNSRAKLIEKLQKNERSRKALIPIDDRRECEFFIKHQMRDGFDKWKDKYIFAYMFADAPELAIQMASMQKFNMLSVSFSDLKQMGKKFGQDYLRQLSSVKQGVEYLLKEADGYGVTSKMLVDSASLKIFILCLLISDIKPYRLKDIIEGIFSNLGYKIRIKLNEQAALKALPVAFFNNSIVFGYPIRQKDSIASTIYGSLSKIMSGIHMALMQESITDDEEIREALLAKLDQIEENVSNLMLYMLIL